MSRLVLPGSGHPDYSPEVVYEILWNQPAPWLATVTRNGAVMTLAEYDEMMRARAQPAEWLEGEFRASGMRLDHARLDRDPDRRPSWERHAYLPYVVQATDVSLLPIDVGFDVRQLGMVTELPPGAGGVLRVRYLDRDGAERSVTDHPINVARILRSAGYRVR